MKSLPSSSFATGTGVIDMIRQGGLPIRVVFFVAALGIPGTPMAGWGYCTLAGVG